MDRNECDQQSGGVVRVYSQWPLRGETGRIGMILDDHGHMPGRPYDWLILVDSCSGVVVAGFCR